MSIKAAKKVENGESRLPPMWGHGVRSEKDSMLAQDMESMYSKLENCPADHKAVPAAIYRYRHGVMSLRDPMQDELANAGGMYADKAAKNPQTYGRPACGGSKSSCGSISSLIKHMDERQIAGLSPSERNKVDTFSSRAIARLARRKEQHDEMEVVDKKTVEAEAKANGEPVSMGEMVDEIQQKSQGEAEDIVRTEEYVKRDVLGRVCPPGTYKMSDAAMVPAMKEKMQQKDEDEKPIDEAAAAMMPEPMFASLRQQQSEPDKKAPAAAADKSPAAPSSQANNLQRADESKASPAAAQKAVAKAQSSKAPAQISDAGAAPVAKGFEMGTLPLIALIGLAVLALLFIAGFVYYLINRGKKTKKPKDFVGRTVANVGEGIGSVVDAGTKAVGSAVRGAVDTGRSAVGGALNVGQAALDVGESAVGTVGRTAGALLEGDIRGAGSAVTGGAADFARKTFDVGSAAVQGVADTAGSAIGGAADVASAAVEGGAGVVGSASDIAGSMVDVVTGNESADDEDDEGEAMPSVTATRTVDMPSGVSARETVTVTPPTDEDTSLGVDDIEEAFADETPVADAQMDADQETADEAPVEDTEDVQGRVEDLIRNTAPLLEETEASDTASDVARESEAVMDAFADEARAAEEQEVE